MFETTPTEDLIRIVAAGGGMRLDGSKRSTDELVSIAAAASMRTSRLTLTGLDGRTTDELVRIAAAGNGSVFFDW